MRYRLAFAAAAMIALLSAPAVAGDVPKDKQTKLGLYLGPAEALREVESATAKLAFIDVRTRAELQLVGYAPAIDGQVPFVEFTEFWEWDEKNKRFKLEPHPTFSRDVEALLARKGLTKSDKVILMCRSGDRSARAANALADAGFTNVWNQLEGFEGDLSPEGRRTVNGWKNAGLPWTYKLDKTKIYLPAQ